MRIPSYLICNNYGKFHFRIIINSGTPLSKGQVFKRSLDTKEYKIAIVLSRALKVKIDKFQVQTGFLQMNWLETKKILNNIVDETIEEYRNIVIKKGTFGDHIAKYQEADLEIEAEEYLINRAIGKLPSFENYHLLDNYVKKITREYKLHTDPDTNERNADQIAEMLVKRRKKRLLVIESMYLSMPDMCKYAKIQFEENKNNNLYKKDLHPPKGILFSDIVKKFIDYKISKNIWSSPKTVTSNKLKLIYIENVLTCIAESDPLYINQLEQNHAICFEKYFSKFPSNLSKLVNAHKNIKETIKSIIGNELIISKNSMSAVTYNSYCDLLTGLLNWAKSPKQNLINDHPFIDIKIGNLSKNKRMPFTDTDIQLFFKTNLYIKKEFTTGQAWRYYVPIIMAYHGLRLEEICQLQVKNIITEDNIDCFDIREEINQNTNQIITKLKTKSSQRIVPLHPVMKKTGFYSYLEMLKSKSESKIFPELRNYSSKGKYISSGAKVSKYFNEDDFKFKKTSYLTRCGINGEEKPRKILYMFRHTVETLLINNKGNIEHDKIDKLLGHHVKSIGRNNYGSYSPTTLLSVLKKIEYPNSKLPWDSNETYSKIRFPWETKYNI